MSDHVRVSEYEKKVLDEIEIKCGEYLELIPKKHWRYVVTPVLVRRLAKALEEIDYLKNRLEHVCRNKTKHP